MKQSLFLQKLKLPKNGVFIFILKSYQIVSHLLSLSLSLAFSLARSLSHSHSHSHSLSLITIGLGTNVDPTPFQS